MTKEEQQYIKDCIRKIDSNCTIYIHRYGIGTNKKEVEKVSFFCVGILMDDYVEKIKKELNNDKFQVWKVSNEENVYIKVK